MRALDEMRPTAVAGSFRLIHRWAVNPGALGRVSAIDATQRPCRRKEKQVRDSRLPHFLQLR